jgi:hypothetical protein
MGRYSVSHSVATASDKALVVLGGSATLRIKLQEFMLGSSATPADAAAEYRIVRTAAAASGGTSLTPIPTDPVTAASTVTAKGGTLTGSPSYADSLLRIGLHQNTTFRWVATPGFELVSVAAANNGLELVSWTAGSSALVATMIWEE